ncbi:MAG: PilN domain-containing protein [Mycobacteriales bacterium]
MNTRVNAPDVERAPLTRLVSLPAVNLLPPHILVRRKLRRVQTQLGGGGVVAVLVVIALFLLALSSVHAASNDLDAAKVQRAGLQTQVDALSNVRQTYALVDTTNGLLRDAGGNEVLWSSYLGDLGPLLPSGAWLTKVTVAPALVTPASTPGAAATATPTIAQITFEGVALSHVNVAGWLDSIAKERAWTNPYFSKSDEKLIGTKKTYAFSSTVNVTTAALSGRYTNPTGS